MPPGGAKFDLIVCNFAFHYFTGSAHNIKNFGQFVVQFLRKGGRLVITAFDGAKIVRLLNESRGNWTVMAGEETKYSIRGEESKDKEANDKRLYFLGDHGQKIEVMLPFGNDYYSEYMVNIEYVAKTFEKLGMKLEINKSFGEYLSEYRGIMEEDDKKYVSLYHFYCFYRT
jgi:SAM-dependent methyltransferase